MRPAHGDDFVCNLYEAAYSGSVSTLDTLIQKDRLILGRISQSSFTETPLHISALLGHLDFTKALLDRKPRLAQEFDSFQRTPLHLASAEGQKEIVQVLLQAYDDACMKPDQDGRIPLHYAAMRGRTEVVRELIGAKPESLRVLDRGRTVLHLCVTYNHIETLKALVEEHGDIISVFLNSKDINGNNTILHLAVMLKQVETIRYLISIPKIREEAMNEKHMGFTIYDILENSPTDCKSFEIQLMLMNAGIRRENLCPRIPSPTTENKPDQAVRPQKEKCWRQNLRRLGNWFKHQGDWLEEMRGNLSLVATMISTITFQAVINPPGGVMQSSGENDGESLKCVRFNGRTLCPGEAVLAAEYDSFPRFLIFNTIAFISSLNVTLLLVSGVPLKNKVIMWILSIGMCATLTFLAFAYLYSMLLVAPEHIILTACHVVQRSFFSWTLLICVVAIFLTIHFIVWLVRKCIKKHKRRRQRQQEGTLGF